MSVQDKRNDEYKPTCLKCGEGQFVAIQDGRVANADKAIPMIICAKEDCQAVVGVLPFNSVWN